MPSALSIILIVVAVTSLVAWLQTEERKSPKVNPSDGSLELRHGKKYLIVTLGSTLFASIALVVALSTGAVSGRGDILGFLVILVAILLLGGWMVLDAVKTRVLVSAEGVRAITPLGGDRFLSWTDIQGVSYNPWAGWLTLKSTGRRPVRVNTHLLGTHSLIKRLREKRGTDIFRGLATVLAQQGRDAA